MLLQAWIGLSRHNIHVHPFGDLITNETARNEIEQKLGIKDMWFVFRLGYTGEPNKTSRLPVEQLIID